MTDFIPFPTPPGPNGETKGLSGDTFSVGQKIFVRTTGALTGADNSPLVKDSPEVTLIQINPSADATITYDIAGGGSAAPQNVVVTGDAGIASLNSNPIRYNNSWGDFVELLINLDLSVYTGGSDEFVAQFGANSRTVITLSSGDVFDWNPSVNTAIPELDGGPSNGQSGSGALTRPRFVKQGPTAGEPGNGDLILAFSDAFNLLKDNGGGTITIEFYYD
mgnify:CR=1 FL=1